MSAGEKFGLLSGMARMVEEAGSARLRQATAARDAVKAQIAALDATRVQAAPQDAGEARIAYGYEQWASRRRAALNLQLAQHEADCLNLMDAARRAFGRARAIERLAAAEAPRRRSRP